MVPDLIGFGRSDKPTDRAAYTYQSHLDWLLGFLDGMDLRGAHLFCQDWGGLLGLRREAGAAGHHRRLDQVVEAA